MKLENLTQTFKKFLKEEVELDSSMPTTPPKVGNETEVSVDSYGDMSPEELKKHCDESQHRLVELVYKISEEQLGMTKQQFFRLILNYGMAYYVYGIKRGSESMKDIHGIK